MGTPWVLQAAPDFGKLTLRCRTSADSSAKAHTRAEVVPECSALPCRLPLNGAAGVQWTVQEACHGLEATPHLCSRR